MINFKPQKGKAFDKLPKKTLQTFDNTKYLVTTKYDGNQIFVVKSGKSIRCFTSDWKEFSNYVIEEGLIGIKDDFTLVGEFMFGCEGKLGDRRNSAILTTLRTNFNKGIANIGLDLSKTNIQFFDIVTPTIINKPYRERLLILDDLLANTQPQINVVKGTVMYGKDTIAYAKTLVNNGYEGCMLVEMDSTYHIGKRVNHSIKLKYRKTADLLCIDVLDGEGKYEGLIGSLVLRDSNGRIVKVGSGLDDLDRVRGANYFIDNIVEIEYEQIIDTYIQPTFVAIRYDKTEMD